MPTCAVILQALVVGVGMVWVSAPVVQSAAPPSTVDSPSPRPQPRSIQPETVRIMLHIFDPQITEDPNAEQIVQDQVSKLMSDAHGSGVHYLVGHRFYVGKDSASYGVVDSEAQAGRMMGAYGAKSGKEINVYVCDFGRLGFRARAVIPDTSEANGTQPTVLLDGGEFGGDRTALSHALEHVLHPREASAGAKTLQAHKPAHRGRPLECACRRQATTLVCDMTAPRQR